MAEKGQYGLLIDYRYCSGCQACVTACKMEHNYPQGDFGIILQQDGPQDACMVYGTVEELARKASAAGTGDMAIFVR